MADNNNAEIIERLNEIVKDVEDITEPSHMDKIMMVLEEIHQEDDEYMELLISKVKDETITWYQPLYQNSTCLTRKPKNECEENENAETGPFTHDEKLRLIKNWRKFVKKFDVPDKPIRLARWKNKGKSRNYKHAQEEFVRAFITAYLARGLQRNLYQVNRCFLQIYAYPAKSKSYNATEERIMEICFYHKPNNAVPILSAVLGREARGIYKKLREYYEGKPEKKKVKWTLELASKLLNHLMSYSGCSLKELKNKQFDVWVWQNVGQEMDHQYTYLQAFWYGVLHVQLFVQCNVKIKTLRRVICKKLLESPYKLWTDIRWKHFASQFPSGFTGIFLYRIATNMFQVHPNHFKAPLKEVIHYITTLKKRRLKRRLKCVRLDDGGNLNYVKHEVDLLDLIN